MSEKMPTVSIIICLYRVGERFFEDLKKFSRLNFTDYEIILATEAETTITPEQLPDLPIRIVKAEGKISLGEKRDLGIRAARGHYCAFIDDDAYPDASWLREALAIFQKNEKVGAVGGPNITAPDDPYVAQLGGLIYESYLTSGAAQFRFIPQPRRIVAELQGVNLIIRRSILEQLGGFRSKLSSGDDTKVCRDIRQFGYQVLYDPKVKVFHHRRPFPLPHLKQIRSMGTHRGFFVKAYPETLAPIYFLPAILAILFLGGLVLSLFSLVMAGLFALGLAVAIVAGALSVIKRTTPGTALLVGLGIILTHIVYGLFFLYGLTLKTVER